MNQTELFKRTWGSYSPDDILEIVRGNEDIAHYDNARRDKRFTHTSEQVEYRLALCEIVEQLMGIKMLVRKRICDSEQSTRGRNGMRTNQCPWCGKFDSYENLKFNLDEERCEGHWEHPENSTRCGGGK